MEMRIGETLELIEMAVVVVVVDDFQQTWQNHHAE
jgi:hypothetical protein